MIKTKSKMELGITNVDAKDQVEKIYLTALARINLKDYLLYDATFTEEGKPSNKGRHVYRFPDREVEAGDKIILLITKGTSTTGIKTTSKTDKALTLYWDRNSPIINDKGDSLTLVRIENEKSFSIGSK